MKPDYFARAIAFGAISEFFNMQGGWVNFILSLIFFGFACFSFYFWIKNGDNK